MVNDAGNDEIDAVQPAGAVGDRNRGELIGVQALQKSGSIEGAARIGAGEGLGHVLVELTPSSRLHVFPEKLLQLFSSGGPRPAARGILPHGACEGGSEEN